MNTPDPQPAAAGARLAATHDAIARALLESSTEPPHAAGGAAAPGLVRLLADRALAPAAQAHPWALVGGAALLGAALATRPWRRAIGTVLMAAVLTPAAGSWVLREVSRALTQPGAR